jgi:hypothetical protein
VNAVAPGTIKTPMHRVDEYAQLAALDPVGRMGEISDIVDAILYLEGAGFVTGEILHVDGGQRHGAGAKAQRPRSELRLDELCRVRHRQQAVRLLTRDTLGARGRWSALHIGAVRRISQRHERCAAVPLTGSTALLPMSRLKLAPSGPNGS